MPINTVRCPHCGARVNHVIKLSRERKIVYQQELLCPRCKNKFTMDSKDISQRTKDASCDLRDFTENMDRTSAEFEKFVADVGKSDTVEEALTRADEVFQTARTALDDIVLDDIEQSIDADKLLETYAVPKVKQFALDKVQSASRKVQEQYGLSN